VTKLSDWVTMHNEEALLADGFEDPFLECAKYLTGPLLRRMTGISVLKFL